MGTPKKHTAGKAKAIRKIVGRLNTKAPQIMKDGKKYTRKGKHRQDPLQEDEHIVLHRQFRLQYDKDSHAKTIITSGDTLLEYIKTFMRKQPREYLVAVFLDHVNNVLGHMIVGVGTLHQVSLHVGELCAVTSLSGATRVVLVHNHVGIVPEPSDRDIHFAHWIQCALTLMEVELIDSIIVHEEGVTSLHNNDLLLDQAVLTNLNPATLLSVGKRSNHLRRAVMAAERGVTWEIE